jgi:hypothetical protein
MDKLSGYIECQIGGMIRPIKFGMGAWKIFTQVTGKSLDEMSDINWLEFSGAIIYAGLMQAALTTGRDRDFVIENVYDWLDEMPDETYKAIMATLAESKVLGRTFADIIKSQQPDEATAPEKKKATLAT